MKFLIVSNNYPPLNDGGVPRIFALKNYLDSKGVEAHVLTNGNNFPFSKNNNTTRIYDANYPINNSKRLKALNFFSRAYRFFLTRIKIYIPYYWVWLFLAKKNIKKLVREENFNFIFISYPSIENLFIGKYILENFRELKLIVDYRDPLIFETAETEIKFNFPKKFKKLNHLEDYLLKKAYLTLTVAPQISSYLKARNANSHVLTITNGFDSNDLINLSPNEKLRLEKEKTFFNNNKFVILYTGTLTHYDKNRKANHLCDAICKLPEEIASKIQFVFYGKNFKNDFIKYEYLISKRIICLRPEVSRNISIKLQNMANGLLLVTDIDRTCVTTGKVFEYLNANKPILGLTKNTHAEQIIKKTKTGICSDPTKPNEIKSSICEILNFDLTKKDRRLVSQYSRTKQFDKLWEHIF